MSQNDSFGLVRYPM